MESDIFYKNHLVVGVPNDSKCAWFGFLILNKKRTPIIQTEVLGPTRRLLLHFLLIFEPGKIQEISSGFVVNNLFFLRHFSLLFLKLKKITELKTGKQFTTFP